MKKEKYSSGILQANDWQKGARLLRSDLTLVASARDVYNGWLGRGGEKEARGERRRKMGRKMRKKRSARTDESRIRHDCCAREESDVW